MVIQNGRPGATSRIRPYVILFVNMTQTNTQSNKNSTKLKREELTRDVFLRNPRKLANGIVVQSQADCVWLKIAIRHAALGIGKSNVRTYFSSLLNCICTATNRIVDPKSLAERILFRKRYIVCFQLLGL